MISREEIKVICLKWWKSVLTAHLCNTTLFPEEIIRIGKVNSKDILSNFSSYNLSIQILKDHSKEAIGSGYTVVWAEKNFDKVGRQKIPERIIIETLEDYLTITGKSLEYIAFIKKSSEILERLPEIKEWLINNPEKVIEYDNWDGIITVIKYFRSNPRPDLFIRQLPVEVHTKFIKENEPLIRAILDSLIPESINIAESKFEKRFNLKYPEHIVRIRFLYKDISPLPEITDLSLPVSQFGQLNILCNKIFVTENIMNFLTLPDLQGTIAVWSGGGFNVSYLKNIKWLKGKQFYYWGDLDAHGFQILNQFRTYFPGTISVMMDNNTLQEFSSFIVKGEAVGSQNLTMLTADELKMYNYLKENNLRLEQEKITQLYANKIIKISTSIT